MTTPTRPVVAVLGETREARVLKQLLARRGLGCAPAYKQGVVCGLDARHPYAPRRRATVAPTLRVLRPPWGPKSDDLWIESPNAAAIVARLGPVRRVFATLGRDASGPFEADATRRYVMRLKAAPASARPPPHISYLVESGPFDVAGEIALFQRLGVEALVARNDGGRGARPKILAARALGLPVYLTSRPTPDAPATHSARAAAAWAAMICRCAAGA